MKEVQVIIPHIGPIDNLIGCLTTAHDADQKIPILIVDNSRDTDTAKLFYHGHLPANLEIEICPDNIGVAASWNRGIIRGAELTIICSASTRFGVGGLKQAVNYMIKNSNDYGIQLGSWPNREDGNWNVGWKFIGFTRQLFDNVGYFDENYWPGYFEDLDFSYRTFLAFNKRDRRFPLAQADVDAAGVSKAGDAIAAKAGLIFPEGIRASGDVVRDYYIAKWGGPSGEEKFDHPFGDPELDIKYWPNPPRRIYPDPGE